MPRILINTQLKAIYNTDSSDIKSNKNKNSGLSIL